MSTGVNGSPLTQIRMSTDVNGCQRMSTGVNGSVDGISFDTLFYLLLLLNTFGDGILFDTFFKFGDAKPFIAVIDYWYK